jgi:hypothetical protein
VSIHAEVDLEIICDKCDDDIDQSDRVYCAKCAGITEPKGPLAVNKIVEQVRWIGDELRDRKVDWRIVERVRELEAQLLA